MELQAAALPAALRGEAPWEYEGEEVTQDGVDERGVHTMVAQGMYGPLLFFYKKKERRRPLFVSAVFDR